MSTIMVLKITAAVLIVMQWIMIVRSQKHFSPVLLVALPTTLFFLALLAVIGSALSGGRVSTEKLLNDAIHQMLADIAIVFFAVIATVGTGIWIFFF